MKSLSFKTGLIAGLMLVVASAQAQSQSTAPRTDAMTALCRVKAKESANLAFRSCMNESKTGEVESIRRDYQEKLAAIKAEYEKELGRVSGKKDDAKQEIVPATEDSKSFEREQSESDSDLMKNAILNDMTDEIQPRDQLIRKAPKFDSASRNQTEKREPKDSAVETPRTKKVKANVKAQIASRAQKAILFNDGMELPEPIPVEAMSSFGGVHQ